MTHEGAILMDFSKLRKTALKVRKQIIRMSGMGGCFIGASLSCADIIVYLYSGYLNINSENLNNPERDYFLLSKGHDVPAVYGMFAELGWISPERLNNHLKPNDLIYWHPNSGIPGIEFHSGSLGHLLSVSTGIALDCKLRGLGNKIVVMLGDGELNEGSNWESLLVANAYKLDNLIIIVDRNEFQANIKTEELIPLEPLDKKFEAFGSSVTIIDGHDFQKIDNALRKVPFERGKPSVIIAKTIRGKGLPSLEKRADRWFVSFTQAEVEELLRELEGEKKANLTSDTLIVR